MRRVRGVVREPRTKLSRAGLELLSGWTHSGAAAAFCVFIDNVRCFIIFVLTWLLIHDACIYIDNISVTFLVFVSHLNERALAGSLAY